MGHGDTQTLSARVLDRKSTASDIKYNGILL